MVDGVDPSGLDRTPPHDRDAELACIAISLAHGRIPESLAEIRPADMYLPAHEHLWATIRDLAAHRKPCDPVAVNARLRETGRADLLPLVVEAVSFGAHALSAEHVATIVIDRSGRRHIIDATIRTAQDAYTSDAPYEVILERAEEQLRKVPARDTGDIDSLLTLDEFLARETPEPEWVIEGLLARHERLILTGVEGWGKSTLLRQLAMCAAAGMDPFTGRSTAQRSVLVIDCENPQHLMQKKFRELRQAISAHGMSIPQTGLLIDRRGEGMNVADPGDRRWLKRRVAAVQPDLLVIGPAYKLHEPDGTEKDEQIARVVTAVLDELRSMCGCALVLEHHAGNEQAGQQRPVRPFGSSLWRRWPEFGYGIRPIRPPKGMTAQEVEERRVVDLVPWKGPRDERSWPRQLQASGDWMPWVEFIPEAA